MKDVKSSEPFMRFIRFMIFMYYNSPRGQAQTEISLSLRSRV
jgi:hypothetical protein